MESYDLLALWDSQTRVPLNVVVQPWNSWYDMLPIHHVIQGCVKSSRVGGHICRYGKRGKSIFPNRTFGNWLSWWCLCCQCSIYALGKDASTCRFPRTIIKSQNYRTLEPWDRIHIGLNGKSWSIRGRTHGEVLKYRRQIKIPHLKHLELYCT